MPVFDRSAFRPKKHPNDPGRAPAPLTISYDGAPIPTTLPKALRNKPPSQQPQKSMLQRRERRCPQLTAQNEMSAL